MDNKICTVFLGKGVLDNDYTVYESGKVYHFYDQSIYKSNVEEWLDAKEIDEYTKNKILDKCPVEVRKQVEAIFTAQ